MELNHFLTILFSHHQPLLSIRYYTHLIPDNILLAHCHHNWELFSWGKPHQARVSQYHSTKWYYIRNGTKYNWPMFLSLYITVPKTRPQIIADSVCTKLK